jgi:hypothetical protein
MRIRLSTSACGDYPSAWQRLISPTHEAAVTPQCQSAIVTGGMVDQSRDARLRSQRNFDPVSLSWALGALASVLLALWSLPFALIVDAMSGGAPWDYGVAALLLVQAALCLAWMIGWLRSWPSVGAVAIGALIAAHAGLWSIVWPTYSTMLWWPWVEPLPMVIPALIQFLRLTTPQGAMTIAIGIRLLLGVAALAWSVLAGFVAHLFDGLGGPDWQVAYWVLIAFAGYAAILSLFFIRGPWPALLVVTQVAGVFSFYLIVNQRPHLGFAPYLVATILLASAFAWYTRSGR